MGLQNYTGPEMKNFTGSSSESKGLLQGCGRGNLVNSSDLPELHVSALEPQPGEQQHDQHVGEGKTKPRGEVHSVFALRKQSGGRNTSPHCLWALGCGELAGSRGWRLSGR